MMDKTVYLITGGIAAGKSTIGYNIINFYSLANLPYICNDLIRNIFFHDEKYENAQKMARDYSDRFLDWCVKENKSFVWETIISKEKKIRFLEYCKLQGYKLITFFVGTDASSVMINRARQRTEQGSHFLGEDFIIDRYKKMLSALDKLNMISDTIVVINNTYKPELVYYRDDEHTFLSNSLPAWVKDNLEIMDNSKKEIWWQ